MSNIGHRSSVNLAEALRKPVSLVSDLKTTASEEDDRRRQAGSDLGNAPAST